MRLTVGTIEISPGVATKCIFGTLVAVPNFHVSVVGLLSPMILLKR